MLPRRFAIARASGSREASRANPPRVVRNVGRFWPRPHKTGGARQVATLPDSPKILLGASPPCRISAMIVGQGSKSACLLRGRLAGSRNSPQDLAAIAFNNKIRGLRE
jgi:hypothetical protein